jgi:hypothetical protein
MWKGVIGRQAAFSSFLRHFLLMTWRFSRHFCHAPGIRAFPFQPQLSIPAQVQHIAVEQTSFPSPTLNL